MTEIEKSNTNPVVTLKAQVKKGSVVDTLTAQVRKLGYKALKAEESNAKTNSGEEMYEDFIRMGFVINGQIIDKNLIIALIRGTEQRELDEIWKEHYEDEKTPDHKKTDQYKEEFERFYNIGKGYAYLLPKGKDNNYRPFAKEVFKEIFRYARAEAPSDLILEELITHCNPSGLAGSLMGDESKPLSNVTFKHGLSFRSIDYTIHINCNDTNCATVRVEEPISVCAIANPQEEMCKLDSLLELTLESQNDKKSVTYKNGGLTLTGLEGLMGYQAANDTQQNKSLIDVIKEIISELIERIFGHVNDVKITEEKGIITMTCSFGKPSKIIESDLKEVKPSKVKSNLKEVKSPTEIKSPTNGANTTKWYI